MTNIINITLTEKETTKDKHAFGKKLWYDVKSKKMIEIDGDIGFNYDYGKGELSVFAKKEQQKNNTKSIPSIISNIEADFDATILSKSKYGNKVLVTIEVSDDDNESLCDVLDHNSVEYYSG